jgi:small subunit ribosomal protein S20
MANHPSAEKRNRQRVKRTDRNRSIKGTTRTIVKKARVAIGAGDKDTAAMILSAVIAVDRAAARGVIHPKKASRTKSRLAKQAHKRAKAASA